MKEYCIRFVLLQFWKFLPSKINGLNHSIPDPLTPSDQSQPSSVLFLCLLPHGLPLYNPDPEAMYTGRRTWL